MMIANLHGGKKQGVDPVSTRRLSWSDNVVGLDSLYPQARYEKRKHDYYNEDSSKDDINVCPICFTATSHKQIFFLATQIMSFKKKAICIQSMLHATDSDISEFMILLDFISFFSEADFKLS